MERKLKPLERLTSHEGWVWVVCWDLRGEGSEPEIPEKFRLLIAVGSGVASRRKFGKQA